MLCIHATGGLRERGQLLVIGAPMLKETLLDAPKVDKNMRKCPLRWPNMQENRKCHLECPSSGENMIKCALGCPSNGENVVKCPVGALSVEKT